MSKKVPKAVETAYAAVAELKKVADEAPKNNNIACVVKYVQQNEEALRPLNAKQICDASGLGKSYNSITVHDAA